MRTTLVIDDDVLSAAKEMAAIEKKTVGEVISSLARKALSPTGPKVKTRNGVPLLKIRKGRSTASDVRIGASAPRGVAVIRFLLDINVLIALIDATHGHRALHLIH